MLNKIRDLSSHPIILLIFGMLILVFILFFGMPSMGGIGQDAALFSQWGARVNDTELSMNEAMLYSRRRATRSNNDLRTLKARLDEMTQEALLDQTAFEMGWVSTEDDQRRYIVNPQNLDLVFFGDDRRRPDEVLKSYKESLPEGAALNLQSARDQISGYLAYAKKGRGFKNDNFENAMASWGVTSQDYVNSKGRELRIRSYLNFMRDQLKISDAQVKRDFHRQEDQWRLSYVKINADNIPAGDHVSTPEEIDTYVKDQGSKIKAYYKKNIENYSKSKLKFTQVTARYSGEAQEAEVKAKVEEAHARIVKGEDPTEVAKSLSQDTLLVSAFVQSNKTRKNTSEGLFNRGLKMKLSACSDVEHKPSPSFTFPGQPPQPKSGTYSFMRLEEREMGEEKAVKDVEREITQVLINEEGRKAKAKTVAEGIIKAVQGGEALAVAIEKYNAQMKPQAPATGETTAPPASSSPSPLVISESNDVKIDTLLDGNIDGVGRSATASELVLSRLKGLSEKAPAIPEAVELNNAWVVLSLKEFNEANDADFEAAEPRLTLATLGKRQGQFLGSTWFNFSLFGPNALDVIYQLPRELLTALSTEVVSLGSERDGFLGKLLETSNYQDLVERNQAVEKYFAENIR